MAAVLTWLAEESANNPVKDYAPIAAGVGAVLGAVIAAFALTRNSKKTPYAHLEILAKARADWPDDLEGRESLDRSIAFALEQIRRIEGGKAHPAPAALELEAIELVDESDRKDTILYLAMGLFLAAFGGLIGFSSTSLIVNDGGFLTFLSFVAVGFAFLTAVAGVLIALKAGYNLVKPRHHPDPPGPDPR